MGILADLDQAAVGIAQVAAPFPAVIGERFGQELSSLGAPFFVTLPGVCYAQVQEAVDRVGVPEGGFEENFRLIWRRADSGIQNDPGIGLRSTV